MKRLIIVLLGCVLCLNVIAQKDYSYIRKEVFLADSLYKSHDVEGSFYHRGMIIDFFRKNRNQCLRDDSICLLVFESCYIYANHQISITEKIECLNHALSIVETNPSWINTYAYKQHVVNLYNIYIGNLIEEKRKDEARRGIKRLLKFAEQHYKIGFSDILLSACSMYSLMGTAEQSIPLYEKLYEMFDELDKIQQYKVVRKLMFLKFNAKDYEKVNTLATRHEKLIRWANDEDKNIVLTTISLSFETVALENYKNKKRYSQKVDDSYAMAYNWIKDNNKDFLPRIIDCWAFYKCKWIDFEYQAIPLFYELLDLIQNKEIDEPLFDKYCSVESVQYAIINIIVMQIYKTSPPMDIKDFMNKYSRLFDELITSQKGIYYKDLMTTLETAYTICYGERESHE